MENAEKSILQLEESLAELNRALEAAGRVYGREWDREMLESASKLHADLTAADLERRPQVFEEHFSARRHKLVDLQERLCGDLVRLAGAHREVIGTDLLGWVRATVEQYWVTHRLGFRGWVAWGCDDAELKGWSAPGWLLDIVPEEIKFGIMTYPPSGEQTGRLPEPSTEVILSWISGRIEMSLFDAATRVLDRATITLASEPGPVSSSQARAQTIPLTEEGKVRSDLDRSPASPAVGKGKRCEIIVQEAKAIKYKHGDGMTMTEIREQSPKFLIWSLADGLTGEDREMFNHPNQWGLTVGYAERLLEKDYGVSRHTVKRWRKEYKKAAKNKPTGPPSD